MDNSGMVYPQSDTMYGGLTKREYFAAKAMQGMCALQDDRYWHKSCGMTPEEWQADILARDAAHAVKTADALLAELAKEQNNE